MTVLFTLLLATLATSCPLELLILHFRLRKQSSVYFVVHFTNKDIVAQIISATISGNLVLASASFHELLRYGFSIGLTNYAAAYCTGLLLARRTLKKLEIDEDLEGSE